MFEQRGTMSQALAVGLRFGLLGEDRSGGVFHEIDAASVALSAVGLLVMARRTLERERGVAPRAEASAFGGIGGALRAFHEIILRGCNRRCAADMVVRS